MEWWVQRWDEDEDWHEPILVVNTVQLKWKHLKGGKCHGIWLKHEWEKDEDEKLWWRWIFVQVGPTYHPGLSLVSWTPFKICREMENEVFSRRNLVSNKGLENSSGVIRSELNYAEKLKTKSARPSDLNSLRMHTRDVNGLTCMYTVKCQVNDQVRNAFL